MKLATIRVENWAKFAKVNLIDFSYINGQKYPAHPVAYDTGYKVAGYFSRVPYYKTIAFEYQDSIWLAASTTEPAISHLAMAWVIMFPRCMWIPEQFGDSGNILDYYQDLPLADAKRVVERLKQSLEYELRRSQGELKKLETNYGKIHKEIQT